MGARCASQAIIYIRNSKNRIQTDIPWETLEYSALISVSMYMDCDALADMVTKGSHEYFGSLIDPDIIPKMSVATVATHFPPACKRLCLRAKK